MPSQHESELSVVETYAYLHEADIAKTLLASYGIEAHILNEHQIRQIAGVASRVRLAVASEHVYRAQQVLEADHSEALDDVEE